MSEEKKIQMPAVHFNSSKHAKWTKAQKVLAEGGREGSGGIPWPPLSQGRPWITSCQPLSSQSAVREPKTSLCGWYRQPETQHHSPREGGGQ